MEEFDEFDVSDQWLKIKIIAACKSFAKVSNSLHKMAVFTLNLPPHRRKRFGKSFESTSLDFDSSPIEILDVTDKDKVISRDEIFKFVSDTDLLFVIADIEDSKSVEVAECIREFKSLPTTPSLKLPYFSMPWEITESGAWINKGELLYKESKCPLVISIILCPSAEDSRLKNINSGFGTWIILPKDKISETGLMNDDMIYQVLDKLTCIHSLGCIIGMDFSDTVDLMADKGRAYVGFGKSFAKEGGTLQSFKEALKSPLLIEEISKAKSYLLVFVGNSDSLSMLEANEANNLLYELCSPEDNLLQAVCDENSDGVTAFVFVTNFD